METATGRRHPITVVGVSDLTPWYRRLVIHAPGWLDESGLAPAAHIMVEVPGEGTPTVPRAYTPHTFTADGFALDVVLHHPGGPGARWAAAVVPGTTATAWLPPAPLAVPDVRRGLLIGDATAIPALTQLHRALDRLELTIVVVEARADRDRIDLTPGAVWVDTLDDAGLADLTARLDPAGTFLWAAGERRLAKTIREFARSAFPVPRPAQHVQTYWIRA